MPNSWKNSGVSITRSSMQRSFAVLCLIFLFPIFLFPQSVKNTLEVIELQCQHQKAPLGIDNGNPMLSWKMTASQRNQHQAAYRILVASQPEKLQSEQGDIWDSGKILSDQSILVEYNGKALTSAKKYYWKVMVWDRSGNPSPWSAPSFWQTGLLSPADWGNAQWIGLDEIDPLKKILPGRNAGKHKEATLGNHALPQFRKEISVSKPIKNATVFISGLGHYEMTVNGKKTGDHFLAPGWTNYSKYSFYNTFDVTAELQSGANVLGVMLGNGFYNVPNERYYKLLVAYGNPKIILKLLIEYADGTQTEIVSDQSWKVTASPVTYSSIYGGEDYDATTEHTGWNKPGYDDSSWKTPIIVEGPGALKAETNPPLKVFQEFKPIKITQPKKDTWIYDLAQNFSGIPQITVTGNKNATVKITPSELLGDDSLVAQKPIGDPVYFNYTLSGKEVETWHPQFTYYGFRYVQIEGAVPEGEPNPTNLPVMKEVKGLHTRNASEIVGSFSCSNELFNRIFNLIDWAVRSNMASVLTDCPHREKLGWLEQTHLMGNSIRYNYDIANLGSKMVQDMQASQLDNGLVPDIAPEFVAFDRGFRDSPEWGSAAVILPWYLYQWYGNRKIIEESYPMMEKYVSYLQSKTKENILYHGLGDWYDLGPKHPGPSQLTPEGITPTATYYYDLVILEKISRLLNKSKEAKKYALQAQEIKDAFNKKFFNTTTYQYGSGSQTANAMAIYMKLVEPKNKAKVFENLVKDIRAHNNAMTAGDIGFRYLIQVLRDEGASDIIYAMNSKSDVPGYGYQLEHGATALTESWAALRYVSNNHFMLGHIMEWFYNGLGGITQPENAVAFKEISINPEMTGSITEVNTTFNSPYGNIVSHWKKNANYLEMNVEIPVNTTAVIYIPAKNASAITEGGKSIHKIKDIKFIRIENGKAIVHVSSGKYVFQVLVK